MKSKKTAWPISLLLAASLLGCSLFVNAAVTNQNYAPPGYINVVAMGATANDGVDDTAAFVNAFATKMSVYVPEGTFLISKPLNVSSPHLVGAGVEKSRIVANIESPTKAIFYFGNSGSYISDLTVGYDESLITGNEGQGERVGMYTGNVWAFAMGASLRNVCFENVGTGIYSLDGDQYAMFSATLESVSVKNFTFRGLDIRGTIRTGNYYRNLYMTSKYPVDSALYLDGEESETVFTGIVVENLQAREPIHLLGVRALRMSGITLSNVSLTEDESGFIYLDNTNGTIDTVTVRNGNIKDYCSLFKMGRGDFYVNHGKGSDTSFVTVNMLNVEKIHSESLSGKNFVFASKGDTEGLYDLEIVNYRYKTDHKDEAEYKAFAKDNESILLTLMGKEQ